MPALEIPDGKGIAFSSGSGVIENGKVTIFTPEFEGTVKGEFDYVNTPSARIRKGSFSFQRRFAMVRRGKMLDASDAYTGLPKLPVAEYGKVL